MSISISAIECYFTPKFKSELLKWARVFQCFLLALLISPFILALGVIVLFCRLLVTIHFKVVHEGKFSLCPSTDGAYAVEEYANTVAINTYGYVKGQTDINTLQQRALTNLINYQTEDGRQPYEKLTWKSVQKYGFFAWEIKNDSFDIRDHVKLCPGMNFDTVYSQQEVQEAIEGWVDHTMNPKRPMWELLYVPKIRMSKSHCDSDELHFATIFRVQHAYMDGISCFQMLRRLCDDPGHLTIDPVNPPIPKPSTVELIGLYALTFFTAPYTYYKMIPNRNNIFQEMSKNKGPKYFKHSDKRISLESIKLIRNKFKCSTTAIFNSVITGALRRAAKRKNLPIPEEIDFGFTMAILPYSNEDPQNKFVLCMLRSPISISDPVKRLNKMNSIMKAVPPNEPLALYSLSLLIGLLPAALIAKIYTTVNCAFAVSNMPGFKGEQNLVGGTIEGIYGCPPIRSGMGFGIGLCSYNGNIRTSWLVEKTKIISSREEMNALVEDFEQEFADLECIANENNQ